MFSSCFHFCWSDDELDNLEGICDSNAIVEITLQRDYLLLKLQELVDSETLQDAERAIRAMDEACPPDDVRLLRFLVRAGTVAILKDVTSRRREASLQQVAAPLLSKLSKHEEAVSKRM
mmetsp:Transcript_9756/g.15644  ORF Transcript_9756/g.15644 Transcript_9756/m.15644 type:complete len:119 (+) Transcript_9756:198-554(+)|eukprot:CAMPEP_0178754908 /NCGR_PEP_ID=MMETSP0744-20121128/12423_1 /TAXON_ID=913974 /ORGANISM="Nitzschia punctata, Strain CCMP561" /LENGTH=118 /DNA_ID=CAMNT_0020408877 /DNA_START=81 /DNA_END=437 /DNA_ORIENTATION=+